MPRLFRPLFKMQDGQLRTFLLKLYCPMSYCQGNRLSFPVPAIRIANGEGKKKKRNKAEFPFTIVDHLSVVGRRQAGMMNITTFDWFGSWTA